MEGDHTWTEWWRQFLGVAPDRRQRALDILRERYIEESQHVTRFTQHAEQMQYPQFREQLLAIAAEETEHLDSIAEKIKQLGAGLPDVPPIGEGKKNSWQYLQDDLEEQQRRSEELFEQTRMVREEFPDIAGLLERMYEEGKRHRAIIRDMLMKSDPQSLWPA